MFHHLAVCTAVLVAVLSNNDALALPQGHPGSLTPAVGGEHDDSYTTKPPTVTPVAMTPATEAMTPTSPTMSTDTNDGSHANDCDPNFPREKTEAPRPAPAATAPVTEPSAVTPAPTTSIDLAKSASKADSDEATTTIEQTALQANTQSGDQKNSTPTGFAVFVVAGVVAAVAAVGAAASQVKKARDADDALVTPGENENIHIEIKRTPAGGSTIL